MANSVGAVFPKFINLPAGAVFSELRRDDGIADGAPIFWKETTGWFAGERAFREDGPGDDWYGIHGEFRLLIDQAGMQSRRQYERLLKRLVWLEKAAAPNQVLLEQTRAKLAALEEEMSDERAFIEEIKEEVRAESAGTVEDSVSAAVTGAKLFDALFMDPKLVGHRDGYGFRVLDVLPTADDLQKMYANPVEMPLQVIVKNPFMPEDGDLLLLDTLKVSGQCYAVVRVTSDNSIYLEPFEHDSFGQQRMPARFRRELVWGSLCYIPELDHMPNADELAYLQGRIYRVKGEEGFFELYRLQEDGDDDSDSDREAARESKQSDRYANLKFERIVPSERRASRSWAAYLKELRAATTSQKTLLDEASCCSLEIKSTDLAPGKRLRIGFKAKPATGIKVFEECPEEPACYDLSTCAYGELIVVGDRAARVKSPYLAHNQIFFCGDIPHFDAEPDNTVLACLDLSVCNLIYVNGELREVVDLSEFYPHGLHVTVDGLPHVVVRQSPEEAILVPEEEFNLLISPSTESSGVQQVFAEMGEGLNAGATDLPEVVVKPYRRSSLRCADSAACARPVVTSEEWVAEFMQSMSVFGLPKSAIFVSFNEIVKDFGAMGTSDEVISNPAKVFIAWVYKNALRESSAVVITRSDFEKEVNGWSVRCWISENRDLLCNLPFTLVVIPDVEGEWEVSAEYVVDDVVRYPSDKCASGCFKGWKDVSFVSELCEGKSVRVVFLSGSASGVRHMLKSRV